MMETTFRLSRHGYTVEEFEHALYCGGVISPWREQIRSAHTGSRCGGHTISVPGNSYVRTSGGEPEFWEQPREMVLDTPGDWLECIQVLRNDPPELQCTRYYVRDAAEGLPDTDHVPLWDRLQYHEEPGGIVIDGCADEMEALLIPAHLEDRPVLRVELDNWPEGCETVILSVGIRQLNIRRGDWSGLYRLELPDSLERMSPPDQIFYSPWLHSLPQEPVYLGNYYCGTPGGGTGGVTELILREGTVGVAACADSHCFWHRIRFPDTVTEIREDAFSIAPCLEELELPAHLRYLGDSAFQNCDRLETLRLPDSLTEPVDSFQLCGSLREVSMPAACWLDRSFYFLGCPRILLRKGTNTEILSRYGDPQPVTGCLSAYPVDGPFTAADRTYPDLNSLTGQPPRGEGDYQDCFGRPVRFIIECDPQLLTRDEIYWARYWFIKSSRGISQVTQDNVSANYMVRDGVTLEELPPWLQTCVEDLFFKD